MLISDVVVRIKGSDEIGWPSVVLNCLLKSIGGMGSIIGSIGTTGGSCTAATGARPSLFSP